MSGRRKEFLTQEDGDWISSTTRELLSTAKERGTKGSGRTASKMDMEFSISRMVQGTR